MRDDPREPPASPAQPSWVGDTEGASVFPEHNPLIGAPAGFASHWSCSVAAKAAFMLERVIVPRFVGKLACPETECVSPWKQYFMSTILTAEDF